MLHAHGITINIHIQIERCLYTQRPPILSFIPKLEWLFQIYWTISLLGFYSTETYTYIHQNIPIRMIRALSYVKTLNWKLPKCLLKTGYIKKLSYSHSIEYYRAKKMHKLQPHNKIVGKKTHKDNVKCKHHTRTYCKFHLSEIRSQAKLIYHVRIVTVLGSREPGRDHKGFLGAIFLCFFCFYFIRVLLTWVCSVHKNSSCPFVICTFFSVCVLPFRKCSQQLNKELSPSLIWGSVATTFSHGSCCSPSKTSGSY